MPYVNNATDLRDVLPLAGVVIGAVLSFIGVFISNIHLQNRRLKSDRKSLAMAFYGEVTAILKIVELRKYVEHFDDIIQGIEQTGELTFVELPVHRNYFNVYEQNVGQIGILEGELPVLIARFYTMGTAILEDVNRLSETSSDGWTPDLQQSFIAELKHVFEIMQNTGNEIIAEVETRYGMPRYRTVSPGD